MAKSSLDEKKIVVNLTERGIIIRLVLMAVTLVIAAYAFYAVFSNVLHTKGEWNTIEVTKPKTTASQEFIFQYETGKSGMTASEEWGRINKVYPEVLDRAYMLLSIEEFTDVTNLYTLSHHLNEEVTVEPELYEALKRVTENGGRYLYLAPVYQLYKSLFACDTDWEAEAFDPAMNEEIRAYAEEICRYAADEKQIRLEFPAENTVKLVVSKEYEKYCREMEIENLIDFFYWKNAFVIDMVADELYRKGFHSGVLTSREGFVRVNSEGNFDWNIYYIAKDGRIDTKIMEYPGLRSVVSLRVFPLSGTDKQYYYVTEKGEIRNAFIDPETGLCRMAYPSMVLHSEDKKCSDMLMAAWNTWLTGEPSVEELEKTGMETVTAPYGELISSDPKVTLRDPETK